MSALEATVGSSSTSSVKTVSSAKGGATKNGIDIVLGAQWGDEGKGKLVDVLSQVRGQPRLSLSLSLVAAYGIPHQTKVQLIAIYCTLRLRQLHVFGHTNLYFLSGYATLYHHHHYQHSLPSVPARITMSVRASPVDRTLATQLSSRARSTNSICCRVVS